MQQEPWPLAIAMQMHKELPSCTEAEHEHAMAEQAPGVFAIYLRGITCKETP